MTDLLLHQEHLLVFRIYLFLMNQLKKKKKKKAEGNKIVLLTVKLIL